MADSKKYEEKKSEEPEIKPEEPELEQGEDSLAQDESTPESLDEEVRSETSESEADSVEELEDELFLSPDDEGGEVLELDSEIDVTADADADDSAADEAEAKIAALTAELAEKEQALAQTREELEETRQERDDFNNRMLRVAADLENYRRRSERDKEDLRRYGIDKVVLELIPAVDDMERALAHAAGRDEDSSMIEGVKMVYRKILASLKKFGVEGFESKGQPFDPQRHEAIQQVETTEADTGTIIEEYQKGYYLHDRLLRPALVVVAKRVDPPEAEEPESELQESSTEQDGEDAAARADKADESADAGEQGPIIDHPPEAE